jgi:hypothetical protein
MVNAGAGATKTSGQKKTSPLAVAKLAAGPNYGRLEGSRNSPWLTCGGSFASGACRPSLFSDLFETLAPALTGWGLSLVPTNHTFSVSPNITTIAIVSIITASTYNNCEGIP